MYDTFIRNRITELRVEKGVSEYQMSLDLGQNKGYIQAISSGRSLPSMAQFLNICDYFEITPMQFFDTDELLPSEIRGILENMKTLDEDDLYLINNIVLRLKSKGGSN